MIRGGRLPSLVLVARSGAGKTTIASGLSAATGCPVVEIGHYVRMDANISGRTPLEEAQRTFDEHRYLYYVERAVVDARRVGLPCIIVGPRMPIELDFLKESLKPVFSVSLTTSDKVRQSRIMCRESASSGQVFDENARDIVEETWGLNTSMANCDMTISADGPPESVAAKLLALWTIAGEERLQK